MLAELNKADIHLEVFMGTLIVSVILFVAITLIVKSLCKKYLKAKKSGECCCGCSGCCNTKCNKSQS